MTPDVALGLVFDWGLVAIVAAAMLGAAVAAFVVGYWLVRELLG
jgi:hypothetical protein